MSVKFFKCQKCGNVVIKLIDSKMPLVCCGEKMEELIPNTSDGAGEKHIPVIVIKDDNIVEIKVSTEQHPSVAEHYIHFIVLETSCGLHIHHLKAGDTPEAKFMIKSKETIIAAYEYCNIHGLWMKCVDDKDKKCTSHFY